MYQRQMCRVWLEPLSRALKVKQNRQISILKFQTGMQEVLFLSVSAESFAHCFFVTELNGITSVITLTFDTMVHSLVGANACPSRRVAEESEESFSQYTSKDVAFM